MQHATSDVQYSVVASPPLWAARKPLELSVINLSLSGACSLGHVGGFSVMVVAKLVVAPSNVYMNSSKCSIYPIDTPE